MSAPHPTPWRGAQSQRRRTLVPRAGVESARACIRNPRFDYGKLRYLLPAQVDGLEFQPVVHSERNDVSRLAFFNAFHSTLQLNDPRRIDGCCLNGIAKAKAAEPGHV